MLGIIQDWSKRTFSDPEVSILLLTLLSSVAVFFFFGEILAPIIASIVIAYILDGFVTFLHQRHCPKLLAIVLVFMFGMSLFLACLLWLFPLIWREISTLVQALPNIANQSQQWLIKLPENYPDLISHHQAIQLTDRLHTEIANLGSLLLSSTVSIIPGILGVVIYMVVAPFLVFFFLKDGHLIFDWLTLYLPKRRRLVEQVWHEVDGQMARYIRGKLIEICTGICDHIIHLCFLAFKLCLVIRCAGWTLYVSALRRRTGGQCTCSTFDYDAMGPHAGSSLFVINVWLDSPH